MGNLRQEGLLTIKMLEHWLCVLYQ